MLSTGALGRRERPRAVYDTDKTSRGRHGKTKEGEDNDRMTWRRELRLTGLFCASPFGVVFPPHPLPPLSATKGRSVSVTSVAWLRPCQTWKYKQAIVKTETLGEALASPCI